MTGVKYEENDETEYNLPRNDAAEFARLDDQANGYLELMKNKIVHAPLQNPRQLLDVGCGTGHVCRHMAGQYPDAFVMGIDISEVPVFWGGPDNIGYITGDIKKFASRDGGPLKKGEIDFIYQRLLICGMTDWPNYVKLMTRLLRPGGFMEIHDYAYIYYKRSSQSGEADKVISNDWMWLKAMRRGAPQLGLDLDIGLNAERYMKEAGLIDVQVVKYEVPFGSWLADSGGKPETRKIGEHQVSSMGKVFSENILPGVTRKLEIGEEEMKELQQECRDTLKEEEGKYYNFYVTWGRKA